MSALALEEAGITKIRLSIENVTNDPAAEARLSGQLAQRAQQRWHLDCLDCWKMTGTPASKSLATLTTPSTAITSGVQLTADGGSAVLRFEFDREGALFESVVRFHKVRTGRWLAESHCTAWHIEGAYDTIVEIEDSSWVNELQSTQPPGTRRPWVLRHFMLFLDSAGYFEFVAESWEVLPDERVS
jgi:hypothetical protein